MTRAYTILFVLSLTPLIGLSWMSAQFGVSTRMFIDLSVIGLVVAAVLAGIGMHYNIHDKWPAKGALAASGLWMFKIVTAFSVIGEMIEFAGAPYALTFFGSLAALAAQLVILVRPLPPPPASPPVPEARIA